MKTAKETKAIVQQRIESGEAQQKIKSEAQVNRSNRDHLRRSYLPEKTNKRKRKLSFNDYLKEQQTTPKEGEKIVGRPTKCVAEQLYGTPGIRIAKDKNGYILFDRTR